MTPGFLRRISQRVPLPSGPSIGLGWRPEMAWLISQREDLAITEVVAESFLSQEPERSGPARLFRRTPRVTLPAALSSLRSLRPTLPIIPHGISLSIGSAEGVDERHVERLAMLVDALDAPLVSEHLAYVHAGDVRIGHLTPIPRTEEMLEIVIRNVECVQQILPVPLALENIAPLFRWPESTIDEASFLQQVVNATGVRLLLDVANLHASAVNDGCDPIQYLEELPLDAVAYVHVAGGHQCGEVYHDTHANTVVNEVLELLGQLVARRSHLPVLLEHDHSFPPHGAIDKELDRIAETLKGPPPLVRSGRCATAVMRTKEPKGSLLMRQQDLAKALTTNHPTPVGFDASRVAIAKRALANKLERESDHAAVTSRHRRKRAK